MKLTKKEILNALSYFDLPSKVEQITVLASGHINDTFRVDCAAISYVLQKINTQIFPNVKAVMETMLIVSEHLKSKKYPLAILSPIPLKTGEYYLQNKPDEAWRLTPFFRNSQTIEKVENEIQAFHAGETFGHFIAALSDLDIKRVAVIIPNFHDVGYRTERFKKALGEAKEERLHLAQKEIETIAKQTSFLEKIKQQHLPIRLTHNDTKISNLLFQKDRKTPLAVIDWDTIMPGNIRDDFGDAVRTFCTNCREDEADLSQITFNKNYYSALKKGFLSTVKTFATADEIESLDEGAKKVILVQAMRFLTDFLANDVYYKTDYALHNLVRTRNQLELYRQFLEFRNASKIEWT